MSPTACFFDARFSTNLTSQSGDQQYEIAKGLWPKSTIDYDSFDPSSYSSFFQYMRKEIENLRHHQRHFAVQNLNDAFDILNTIRENSTTSQGELIRKFSENYLNLAPVVIRRSLELSVRLWLTLNVNSSSVAVGPIFPYETPLD